MTAELGRGVYRLVTDQSRFVAGLKAAEAQVNTTTARMSRAFGRAGRTMTAIGSRMTTGITYPVAVAAGAGIKMALDFNKSMTDIKALVGASDAQFKQYNARVLDLAQNLPVSAQELADAMYFITSSGYEGAAALKVLEQSGRAAAAGLGDTKGIADTVTSALKVFVDDNLTAKQSVDALVAAVREGKGEPDEFASSIGRVIPIAAQMGVSFQEILGGVSSLTLRGFSAQKAVTGIRAALIDLLKPSAAGSDVLKEIGLSAEWVSKGIEKDFIGTLTELQSRLEGNNKAQSQLFDNTFAWNAVSALVGKNLSATNEVMGEVQNSAGDSAKALANASKETEYQIRLAWNKIKTTLLEVGRDTLLPIVKSISEFVSGLADRFRALDPVMKSNVLRFIAIAAAAGPVLLILGALSSAIGALMRPWNLVIGLVAVLIGKLSWLYSTNEDFRDSVNKIASQLWDAAQRIFPAIVDAFTTLIDIMAPILVMFAKFIRFLVDSKIAIVALGVAMTVLAVTKVMLLAKNIGYLVTGIRLVVLVMRTEGIIAAVRYAASLMGVATATTAAGTASVTTAGKTSLLAGAFKALASPVGIVIGLLAAAAVGYYFLRKSIDAEWDSVRRSLKQTDDWLASHRTLRGQTVATGLEIDTLRQKIDNLKKIQEQTKPGTEAFAEVTKRLERAEAQLNKEQARRNRLLKEQQQLEAEVIAQHPELARGLGRQGHFQGVNWKNMDAMNRATREYLALEGQLPKALNDAFQPGQSLQMQFLNSTLALRGWREELKGTNQEIINLGRSQRQAQNAWGNIDQVSSQAGLDPAQMRKILEDNAPVDMRDALSSIKGAIPGLDKEIVQQYRQVFRQIPESAYIAFSQNAWRDAREAAIARHDELIKDQKTFKDSVAQVGGEVSREINRLASKQGMDRAMSVWGGTIDSAMNSLRDVEGTVRGNAQRIMQGFISGILEKKGAAKKSVDSVANEIGNELAKKNYGKIGSGQITEFAKGLAKKSDLPYKTMRRIIDDTFKKTTSHMERFAAATGGSAMAAFSHIPPGTLAKTKQAGLDAANQAAAGVRSGKEKVKQAMEDSLSEAGRAGKATAKTQGDAIGLSFTTALTTKLDALDGTIRSKINSEMEALSSFAPPAVKVTTKVEAGDGLGSLGGLGGNGTLTSIGRNLQAKGFLVGEHPAFGGVAPVHTEGSYHYRGRALDINWPGANEAQMLGALAQSLQSSFGGRIAELFWPGYDPVGGHSGHLHLAMASGAIISKKISGMMTMGERNKKEAVLPLESRRGKGMIHEALESDYDKLHRAVADGFIKAIIESGGMGGDGDIIIKIDNDEILRRKKTKEIARRR